MGVHESTPKAGPIQEPKAKATNYASMTSVMKTALRSLALSLALLACFSLMGHAAQHDAHQADSSHCNICHTSTIPVTTSMLAEIPRVLVESALRSVKANGYLPKLGFADPSRAPPIA